MQQPAPMSALLGEVPAGSAMVYMPFQTGSKTYDRYKHKQSIGLGITQIILGILCIIFNSICIGVSYYPGYEVGVVGHGYWCGILFMITGIFGVIAGKTKTKCQIITFMVLCIISAAFTIALLVVGIIGASTARKDDCLDYGYFYDYYPYYRKPCSGMSTYGAVVAMESLLAISGLVEAIVAIWASTLCCRSGICCSSSPMGSKLSLVNPEREEMQQQSAPMSAPVGEVPAGSAMVCMPFQTGSKICDRFKHKKSIGLGITQIILGILCIIFNSVCLGLSYYDGLASVSHGYWCGILFMITGIFGVIAGNKKTRCQIITFMVLCIISAAFTIALLVVGILGALTARKDDCPNYGYSYDYYPSYRKPCYTVNYEAIVAMESLLAISGLVEAIVAIWGSALCCGSGIGCCSSPMIVLPSADYFPHTGQMIYIGQTQGGQYVYAPQPTFSHDQGTTAPPAYVQPGWAMPTTNIGLVLGQAPPAYMANQEQPLCMILPSRTSQGLSAAQALSTDPAGNEMKKMLNVDEC